MSRDGASGASSSLRESSPRPWGALPCMTTSSSAPTSMHSSTLVRKIGTSGRRALIDTSILIDLGRSELSWLAAGAATSALAIAELARGPGAATADFEKRRRRGHLAHVEASIEALSFDVACAHAYGVVCEAVERAGRKARDSRAVDLMIAATALAHALPLYTLNPKDLHGLEDLIEIVDLSV